MALDLKKTLFQPRVHNMARYNHRASITLLDSGNHFEAFLDDAVLAHKLAKEHGTLAELGVRDEWDTLDSCPMFKVPYRNMVKFTEAVTSAGRSVALMAVLGEGVYTCISLHRPQNLVREELPPEEISSGWD